MQVFVSEYVCGGGWVDPDIPASLEREGLAMLRAVVQDLSLIPDCQVVTTLGRRCSSLDMDCVRIIKVSDPEEERRLFLELAAESDASLVIAPELNHVLHERCVTARRAGAPRVLNPASDVVRLCSDKLLLSTFLQEHGVPTIETFSFQIDRTHQFPSGPVVVKPRHGAGSQNVQTYTTMDVALREISSAATVELNDMIVQPLVPGTPVSIGVIGSDDGTSIDILPVASQRLSEDGRFEYRGGQVPWDDTSAGQVEETVHRACQTLSGLTGYVGFDLIVPHDAPHQPVIVEINPRLTTSYLGYRRLTNDNLAGRMLSCGSSAEPLCWKSGRVTFSSDGRVVCSTAPIERISDTLRVG